MSLNAPAPAAATATAQDDAPVAKKSRLTDDSSSSGGSGAAAAASPALPPPARPIKRSSLYTREGDKGTSLLKNMTRLDKGNDFFKALGDTDELSACLGLAREFCASTGVPQLSDHLVEIQSRLLDIAAAISTPSDGSSTAEQMQRAHFAAANIDVVERWIDTMDHQLPQLTNFVLPSGGLAAAQLHVARSVCRRAERRVAPLARQGLVQESVAVYLNRLSDFLFVAGRLAAFRVGGKEVMYHKAKLHVRGSGHGRSPGRRSPHPSPARNAATAAAVATPTDGTEEGAAGTPAPMSAAAE